MNDVAVRRALVVDPDPGDRQLLAAALAKRGWRVDEVADASEAGARLIGGGYRLLCTELSLGEIDGLTLIRTCRARAPTVSTILVSGTATARDVKSAEAAGAVDVLCKPFTNADVDASLRRIRSPSGLQARFDALSFVDVLQICHQLRRTTSVVLPGVGRVVFEDGEVVHAEAGLKTGREALEALVQVEGGAVQLDVQRRPAKRTVEIPFTRLMLAVLTAADEQAAGRPVRDIATPAFDDDAFDAAFAPFETNGPASPTPDDGLGDDPDRTPRATPPIASMMPPSDEPTVPMAPPVVTTPTPAKPFEAWALSVVDEAEPDPPEDDAPAVRSRPITRPSWVRPPDQTPPTGPIPPVPYTPMAAAVEVQSEEAVLDFPPLDRRHLRTPQAPQRRWIWIAITAALGAVAVGLWSLNVLSS